MRAAALHAAIVAANWIARGARRPTVAQAGPAGTGLRAASTALPIISSDTTIGVALVPAVYALGAKCDVTVKDRNDAPVSRILRDVAPRSGPNSRPRGARARRAATTRARLRCSDRADVVVAFGGETALQAIRAHVRGDARFIAFGHRASALVAAPEALSDPAGAAAWAEWIVALVPRSRTSR